MRVLVRFLLVLAALAVSARSPAAAAAPTAQRQGVLIFAASSMKTALDAVAEGLRRDTGISVRASYASSAVLARQIVDGAPADLFVSADLDWMDYADARGAIRRETRRNLVGNALVLVAPAASEARLTIAPGFPLAATLGAGRLAIGEPSSVPAGKYARAALTSLGVWESVAPKLAPAETSASPSRSSRAAKHRSASSMRPTPRLIRV
jgi:molybdate transport system substrate-binding protein